MTGKYHKKFTMDDFIKIYETLDSIKTVLEIQKEVDFSRVVLNVRLNEMLSVGVVTELWRDRQGKHLIKVGNLSKKKLREKLSQFVCTKEPIKYVDYEKEFKPETATHRRVVFTGDLAERHHETTKLVARERKSKVYIGSTFNMV